MLPQKTFEIKNCILYESDYDVSSQIKPRRVMEFMQDLATTHGDKLGFGWDFMDANGLFWVISKVKIVFDRPLTRNMRQFKLYTWPVAPNRFFIERRFVAVGEEGERLFSCSTIWMIVERDSRKIASQETIAKFYRADFDNAPCNAGTDYARIRRDNTYSFSYERVIRRTDLDINKHVNNTNYVNFALDALDGTGGIRQIEIVYHKELKLGDNVEIFVKREDEAAFIVGERNGETCFTSYILMF
ncbi:MAG: thioesterase [Clostridia bacterium]|nr:thioesterase [Clostridia bacterium]